MIKLQVIEVKGKPRYVLLVAGYELRIEETRSQKRKNRFTIERFMNL
jgi:hypothetical protein